MKTILVFKTSVTTSSKVIEISPLLDKMMDTHEKWNFDLEDCDHILRVEAFSIKANAIIESLGKAGFSCVELPD